MNDFSMENLCRQALALADTPQGLVLLAAAVFLAATLLLTIILFLAAKCFRKKPPQVRLPKSGAPGSQAIPIEPQIIAPDAPDDPLSRFEPDLAACGNPAAKRRGQASIGLARLREEAEDYAGQTIEPTFGRREAEESAPIFAREPAFAPEPAPSVDAKAPEPLRKKDPVNLFEDARLLLTLPFERRPGLKTAHADICGMSVEAVFFDPDLVSRIEDPAIRLMPFLPAGMGKLLARESDRQTYVCGNLHAQPDAVIELKNGLIALEYKTKGGRSEDELRWAEAMREKDLIQTAVEALVLAKSTGRPAAAVLRTHNAVFFLRLPADTIELLGRSAEAAEAFMTAAAQTPQGDGLSASTYAELMAVSLSKRHPKARSRGSSLGEALHEEMLR